MRFYIFALLLPLSFSLGASAQDRIRTTEQAHQEDMEELLALDGLAKLKAAIGFTFEKPQQFQQDQ